MSDSIHFLSLHWNDERPLLQYRTAPDAPPLQYAEIVVGALWTLHVEPIRMCIGYYDFVHKHKVPCPFGRRLDEAYDQCVYCQRQEVTYYTFTGYGANPAAAEAYLATQSHQAYLALFGRDLLKVGVASEGRRVRRTLEQGAVASIFFARANGTDIRQLEEHLRRELGIKDRVTVLQKAKRLAQQPTREQAAAVLDQAVKRVVQTVPSDVGQHLVPEPAFHFLQPAYQLQLDPTITNVLLINNVTGGDTFSGVVCGVVGNLLVLQADDQRTYLLPMKRVQGYRIIVADVPQPMRVQRDPKLVLLER